VNDGRINTVVAWLEPSSVVGCSGGEKHVEKMTGSLMEAFDEAESDHGVSSEIPM
jgi:GTP-dependent phosphoenolpyruvate carboxykinase